MGYEYPVEAAESLRQNARAAGRIADLREYWTQRPDGPYSYETRIDQLADLFSEEAADNLRKVLA